MGWQEDVQSLAEQESRKLDAKAASLQAELAVRDQGLTDRETQLRGEVEGFLLGNFNATENSSVRVRGATSSASGYGGKIEVERERASPWPVLLGLAAIYWLLFKKKRR